MSFQVFDNGRPADITEYPNLDPSWFCSRWYTLEGAIEYARKYFYPYSHPTEVGKPIDYSGCGDMAEIRKV